MIPLYELNEDEKEFARKVGLTEEQFARVLSGKVRGGYEPIVVDFKKLGHWLPGSVVLGVWEGYENEETQAVTGQIYAFQLPDGRKFLLDIQTTDPEEEIFPRCDYPYFFSWVLPFESIPKEFSWDPTTIKLSEDLRHGRI